MVLRATAKGLLYEIHSSRSTKRRVLMIMIKRVEGRAGKTGTGHKVTMVAQGEEKGERRKLGYI